MDDAGGTERPTDATAGQEAPVLDVAAYLTDPDAELHRCAAAHWYAVAVDERGEPLPLVLGHDGARSALRDRRLSARSFTEDMVAAGLSERTALQLTPLFSRDGDEHRRFRGLLAAAFTPRSVERLRPLAAEVATRLAGDVAAVDGTCEFVSTFAAPLPPEVFVALFGLPVEDRDRLAHWGSVVTDAFVAARIPERRDHIEEAAAEMRDWSAELIERRRREPGDDLVSALLTADVDGHRLDDEDVTAVITGFVFAGSETTKRQLTRAVEAFAAHPADWRRLGDDPGLVEGAVEEVLRTHSIIPGLSRVAVAPFEQDGLVLEAGERLATSFVTANDDPRVFDHPERFDITRPASKEHLTFGWGPHFCLGAGLARVELQEALRALVTRFDAPLLDAAPPTVPADGFGAADVLRVRFPSRR